MKFARLRSFALIVSAHPYCARNSLHDVMPRHALRVRAVEEMWRYIAVVGTLISVHELKEARNSFVGRAQTGFQFTRETQKLKRTNKNVLALSSGFNILRRSFKTCV